MSMATEARIETLDPGEPLVNIYQIRGTLTCRSPLHIGSGLNKECDPNDPAKEAREAFVQTDCQSRPIVTGSGLRGVIRALLLDAAGDDPALQRCVWRLLGPDTAGTGEAEAASGKVCFEDAPRTSIPKGDVWHRDAIPNWNPERGTYQLTSVVIDPILGTAQEHLLYKIEVVPEGTKFSIIVSARNMLDEEIGMLLWALDVLGDGTGVATLGAHAGRGFGRVAWELTELSLQGVSASRGIIPNEAWHRERRKAWRDLLDTDNALLDHLTGTPMLARAPELKSSWQKMLTACTRTNPLPHVLVTYTLTLDSGLVVRGGDTKEGFHLEGGSNPKQRGSGFALKSPGQPAQNPVEVTSLAWHVVVDDGGTVRPQFQISGSSLRGGLRSYLKGSLDRADTMGMSSLLDKLFGTQDARGQIEFENATPSAGALRWRYQDYDQAAQQPLLNPPVRVMERGPLDHITQGARYSGLHHFMAVEIGSQFTGRVLLREATPQYLSVLRLWANALATKQMVVGGVGAVGYGTCNVSFAVDRLDAPPEIRDAVADLNRACTPTDEATEAILNSLLRLPKREADPGSTHQLDAGDATEPTHAHHMNPYDFVPFATKTAPTAQGGEYLPPRLRTLLEWEDCGDQLVSGKLTVKLTALQPVHIVGRRNRNRFDFHRVAGKPTIPAASLRGVLRSFIEARWNCWVSSYSRNQDWHTPVPRLERNPYVRVYGKSVDDNERKAGGRYAGFNTDTEWEDFSLGKSKGPIGSAIPAQFLPPEPVDKLVERKIDLSSFLFGAVWQTRAHARNLQRSVEQEQDPALRGRIRLSDCRLEDGQLSEDFWIPDLQEWSAKDNRWREAKAFIGGAKPSRSSMMYFRYGKVAFRKTAGHEIAQFLGSEFRGRKFYFHQDWHACVTSYLHNRDRENLWAQGRESSQVSQPADRATSVVERPLQCLQPQQSSHFEIQFQKLPWRFVVLLVSALENPGTRIRHKLGYAKAFGFGSIDLQVTAGALYSVDAGPALRMTTLDATAIDALRKAAAATDWSWACDPRAFDAADRWLRYLLTYPTEEKDLQRSLFSYPGFKQSAHDDGWVRGFAVPNEHPNLTIGLTTGSRAARVDDTKRYWVRGKHTLDLGLYQRRSTHFRDVCVRAGISDSAIHGEVAGPDPVATTPPPAAGGGAPRQKQPPAPSNMFQPRLKRGEKRR